MIYFLAEYLQEYYRFNFPLVFSYYSTRMMLAAISSLLFCIFLGPFFIKKLYEMKIGQTIRMEECPLLGQLHQKKKDTPTMGGILILASMLFSMLLWMDLRHVFTLIMLVTTLFLGLIGGYDDYLKLKYKNAKGLSARKKFIGQIALALLLAIYLFSPSVNQAINFGHWFHPPVVKEQIVKKPIEIKNDPMINPTLMSKTLTTKEYSSRIYLPFYKEPLFILSGWSIFMMIPFIIFVVAGSSNAVNLTDGLDGLATGCLIMVAACLAFIAFISNHIVLANYLNVLYIEGSGELAIYLCAFTGACLGFLWYNSYPAQVFMGDTGSLALGGILGVAAVLLRRELLLGLIGGVFVAETLSVILQVSSFRWRSKKRIFLCTPLHHHFEYKGWPETKIVIRFWIIGLLLAIIGMASLKFQ